MGNVRTLAEVNIFKNAISVATFLATTEAIFDSAHLDDAEAEQTLFGNF